MRKKAKASVKRRPAKRNPPKSTPSATRINVVCVDAHHTLLGQVLPVEMPYNSKTGIPSVIIDLVKEIASFKARTFEAVELDSVVVWRVKSPRSERSLNLRPQDPLDNETDLQEYIHKLDFKSEVEQYYTCDETKIKDLVPYYAIPALHLQIIIEVPVRKKRHRQLVDDDSEPGDIPPAKITALNRRDEFLKMAKERTYSGYPSNITASNKINDVIRNDWRTVCDDFPPELYHPALATLRYDLETSDCEQAATISDNDLNIFDLALKFYMAAIRLPEPWGIRRVTMQDLFLRVFDENYGSDTTLLTHPDIQNLGVYWGRPVYLILEMNPDPEFVAGNASLQAVRAYISECSLLKGKKTVFPAVLISVMDSVLEISTIVITERIHYMKILHLEIRGCMDPAAMVKKLVHITLALKKYAETLKAENDCDLKSLGSKEWNLPRPTIHPSYQHLNPNLTFKCPLNRRNEVVDDEATSPSSLFLADMSGKEVVVKFTSDHNQDAHKVLAAQHLAPELHGCYPLMGCGKTKMIVMDRVAGAPMSEYDRRSLPSSVFNDVNEAIRLLHAENIVFGDLRACNIMVVVENDVKRAMLVDFDWAGRHHEDFYPVFMNRHLIGDEWHGDVGPHRRLQMHHDDWALQKIINKYQKVVKDSQE